MSERIIWTDRSGALVGGGEPDTTRYVRADVCEVMAEALLSIVMADGAGAFEIAQKALQKQNDLP